MGGIGEPSSVITGEMSKLNDERNALVKSLQDRLRNSFNFIESAFEGDNEMRYLLELFQKIDIVRAS